MIFGAWLGASNHLNYGNSHAHINLLGFVTSVLFGLLHHAWPALRTSHLAVPQFIVYEVGVLLLVIGKVLVDGGTAYDVSGSGLAGHHRRRDPHAGHVHAPQHEDGLKVT